MLDCFKEMLRGVVKAFDWMELENAPSTYFRLPISMLALFTVLLVYGPLSYFLTFHTRL